MNIPFHIRLFFSQNGFRLFTILSCLVIILLTGGWQIFLVSTAAAAISIGILYNPLLELGAVLGMIAYKSSDKVRQETDTLIKKIERQ